MPHTPRVRYMYNMSVNPRGTHLQVADAVRTAVTTRREGYTGRLPSMTRLCNEHHVSRSVIHRALHRLKDEGLLEPVQGVAWYVTGTVDTRPADVRIKETLSTLGFQPGQRILSEAELVEHLDLSRVTVRRALAQLEGQGLISAATTKGRTLL